MIENNICTDKFDIFVIDSMIVKCIFFPFG